MIIVSWTVGAEGATAPVVDIAALFDAHGDFLLRNIRRWVVDASEADDVLQDVFLIANQKRATLDPAANVRAWLYGTARNVAHHRRRHFARQQGLVARANDTRALEQEGPPMSDQTLEQQEDIARVRACAAQLPPRLRDVFVLYELEAVSGKEIALLLNISENAVWTRLHRARARFKKSFVADDVREAA